MNSSDIATPQYADHRRHVGEMVTAALAAADAEAAVQRYLRRQGQTLFIGQAHQTDTIDLERRRVYLVSVGKAAVPMARAALKIVGANLAGAVVITKAGKRDWENETRGWPAKVFQAGHPVPDEAGVEATRAVTDMLAQTRPEDVALCLISGGTSALLTQPTLGLADWQRLIGLLLNSGCTISELNMVRRAVDRIKAGGLARAAAPAVCYGLILSDAVGNALSDIGSGPTVPEDELVTGAVGVLGRYDIARQMDQAAWQRLAVALNQARIMHRGPRPTVRNIIVGDVRQAATAALVRAMQLGFVGQLLTARLEGEARTIGRLAAGIARDMPPGNCLILGGETTVTVRGKGTGGRNQELALAAALALDGEPRTVIGAFGTDGEDGATDAAGAIVTGDTVRLARGRQLEPVAYLADNDSHSFFRQLDAGMADSAEASLIVTGPTGTNVNDLLILLTYGR